MSAPGPSDDPLRNARRQVNVRLRGTDQRLLEQLSASTGLAAAQVVRMLIRQGGQRLALEEQARRREEDGWRRYLAGLGGNADPAGATRGRPTWPPPPE